MIKEKLKLELKAEYSDKELVLKTEKLDLENKLNDIHLVLYYY